MPLSINTNIASMTAQRSFLNSSAALETAFERLSTGKRINSAVDDAAGLAIGTEMEARVSGLNQAIRNVNDGISMVQIAEGALDEVSSILQKMRDLSVQAMSDGLSADERAYIDTEHSKLADAMNAVFAQAKFNGTTLISSSGTVSLDIQAGATTVATDTVNISISQLSDSVLGVSAGQIHMKHETGTFDLSEATDAAITDATLAAAKTAGDTVSININATGAVAVVLQTGSIQGLVDALNASVDTAVSKFTFSKDSNGDIVAVHNESGDQSTTSMAISDGTNTSTITLAGGSIVAGGTTSDYGLATIDSAIQTINSERSNLGALQSQLESTVRNLANVAENTAAAAGRIMDTDYAAETANLTKAQILQQAATSVLAQANAQPQAVLSLLQ